HSPFSLPAPAPSQLYTLSLHDALPIFGGWPTNASWVSSNNVLTRVNFVVSTLGGLPKLPSFGSAHQTHVDGIVSEGTAQLLNGSSDDQTRWLILLASPEFQLK